MLDALAKIPYNGFGTKTGKALVHLNDVILAEENGNRPDAVDIIFLITDGRSQDGVRDEAIQLRARGAAIYVIGVEPGIEAELYREQLYEIAGNPQNVFIVEEGFAGLSDLFREGIQQRMCPQPCEDF
uniref:VWFA domain-containing protein n=1 Tax=Ciona savignyi TaxID=51511 RepID=H2Z6J5_CIOSA